MTQLIILVLALVAIGTSGWALLRGQLARPQAQGTVTAVTFWAITGEADRFTPPGWHNDFT